MSVPLRAAGLLPLALLGGACVYLNSLYNADRAFRQAEDARLAGRDTAARAGYGRAAEGADRSWRREPGGEWADDALYLLGRARLRREEWGAAREALERARRTTADEDLRLGATLYLGAVAVATGDGARALPLLNEALGGLGPGRLRGEGHLWRARLLLSQGLVDQGWWDLERAGEEDAAYRVPAALERLTWGVVHGDSGRAAEGARALLDDPGGAARRDTVVALVALEERLRGPGRAAGLLAAAPDAGWGPAEQDRMMLLRAGLRTRAADTAGALEDAAEVAAGVGAGALEARLFLARVALARAREVADLEALRAILLPALDDERVPGLLEAAGTVALLVERGRGSTPLALFAAAELSRDRLAAPALAAALFVEYAEREPDGPWRGKALLAALGVTADDRARTTLRGRLARLPGDPYAAAARGEGLDGAEYQARERELALALAGLLPEVTAEARRRDVLVRERADTLPGGGP